MDDLTAFITARLDEDEVAAKAATAGPWGATGEDILSCSPHPAWAGACVANAGGADGDHIARHDPARVLREVAAKRKLVEEVTLRSTGDVAEIYLATLAAVWSDHPDYKQEWAL